MKLLPLSLLALVTISFQLVAGQPIGKRELILSQQDHQLAFHPQNGRLILTSQQGSQEVLADSSFLYEQFEVVAQDDSSISISYPDHTLHCRLTFHHTLDISLRVTAMSPQEFTWPTIAIAKASDFLIWPQNGGYYIPFSDSLFSASFGGRSFTAAELSLPFWAIERDSTMLMYEMASPFRKHLQFNDLGDRMEMSLTHTFSDLPGSEHSYEIKIVQLHNSSPISAALHFRASLEEKGDLVSFQQKTESVPLNERMIGAPFIRLIEGQFLTIHDILPGQIVPLAQAMLKEIDEPDSHVGRYWSLLTQEEQAIIQDVSTSDRLNQYQQIAFVRALDKFLNTEGVNAEFAQHIRENAEAFYQAYPESLLPPSQWGRGVSIRMIDALREAGIEKGILQAIGHRVASDRREVAKYAVDNGYLYGIYDSYHSIHPPSTFGTDDSWETAQMPGVNYDSARMQRKDGSFYGGFRAEGGLANPRVIRPYYEARISSNFEDVPYSYYFIDCDAFGEYRDDYSPLHPLTAEENAKERFDRLSWLRTEKKVPIGSEKGTYLFSNVLDINEGVATPLFGFWDKDLRDKNSPYFKGKYWPPEMIEIDFKEVPMKDNYIHLYFDPRFKLPLWETVYHDCLISTAHPYTPSLKYTNIRTELALTEIFYQYPPVYNLNLEYFEQHQDRIAHHYQFYRKTHPQTIHQPVTAFEYLSEDRLVQQIHFLDIVMIANYSSEVFHTGDIQVPAHSILFIDEKGEVTAFSPEEF